MTDEMRTQYFNRENQMLIQANDSGALDMRSGGARITYEDTNASSKINSISGITIADGTGISSHLKNELDGVSKEEFVFNSGGALTVAISSDGTLKEFSLSKMHLHITRDNEFIISDLDADISA